MFWQNIALNSRKKLFKHTWIMKEVMLLLQKKFGIASGKDIRKWVNAYKAFGADGLKRSRENKKYTFDFKMSVVELYLTSEISYQELALSVGITNPVTITKWVNDFRIAGPDALRPKMKGRKRSLDVHGKKTILKSIENTSIDTSAEHIKQLEEELLKLRIENYCISSSSSGVFSISSGVKSSGLSYGHLRPQSTKASPTSALAPKMTGTQTSTV